MSSNAKGSWFPNLFRRCLQGPASDPSPSTSPISSTNPDPPNIITAQPTQTMPPPAEVLPRHAQPKVKESSAVVGVKKALKGLQASLDMFPPLKLAVGGLLDCIPDSEVTDQNRQAYDDVLMDLVNLATQLQAHITESKPTYMPYSINNVARCIEEQTRHIQVQRDRSRARQFESAEEDCEDLLRCYRQLSILFKQLQMDISLSIWDVVRKQYVDTRMKDLAAADDAYYNSALTTAVDKRQGCTPGTRIKILEEAKSWTQPGNSTKVYWMNGMAGTGKTTIAYSLCKLLEADKQLAASFFCSRYSPTCRDVNKIVPTIAYQLSQYSSPYREALCRALDSSLDIAKRDLETQFNSLILQPLESVKEAIPSDLVVVIDALDECADMEGTKQVLDLLFRHLADLPVKFFVTSRPEPAIADTIVSQESGSHLTVHLHDIEASFVQADIRIYLASALATLQPAPSTEQIEALTSRAGRLFIFAATVVRYISPGDSSVDHDERLTVMLDETLGSSTLTQGYAALDGLYSKILAKALEEGMTSQNETEMKRRVLRTVICARETLDASTLAQLLGLKDKKKVELAIKPLQSVLHVSPVTGVISTLHASFPDFLLNAERSERFYCNQVEHSAYLATRSFEVMRQSLRFNICELESSYQSDKDIPELQSRIDAGISPGLFYACRYWSDHLTMATASGDLTSLLEDFLAHRLLFWMEVLSLKQCADRGEGMLGQVLSWLPTDATNLSDFTYDARNFVTTFAANPTSRSTSHIYISTLPFTSKQSMVWATYRPRTQGLIQVEGAAMEARGTSALATWVVGSNVYSIARSSGGKRIASGSGGKEVSIWDASSGARILGPLEGHKESVWSVAFSPDNSRIASGSLDNNIRIWDARNGDLIAGPLLGHTGYVNSATFSPDGALLASGSRDHTIRMWNAHTGASVGDAYKGHQGAVRSVAFSPGGQHLASGSEDCSIRVWDSRMGIAALAPMEGHTKAVMTIAYSSDGLRLASGSEDCTVRVWDMSSGKLLVGPFEGHTKTVSSVSFSPNNTRVVSGSYDHTIRVWEATSGSLLAGPFEGHSGDVNAAFFTTDGTRILSGSDDGTIRAWDARHSTTGATESPGHTGGINSVALSPDGARVASGSSDKTICVWDTHNGALVAGPLTGHTGEVRSVAFSPDGARIVSGSGDRTLRTWDASTGTLLIGPIEGHTGSVYSVALSPDGCQIASGSGDETIRLWNSHTGASIAEPFVGHTERVTSVAFSPDSARIVSGSYDDTVRMWDANSGTVLWASSAHTDDVNCVVFSPDGTRVVSGSDDETILVLNAGDGAVLHGPFTGHTNRVWSVAFSPDGTRVVSGSWDKTMRVWDVESGTTIAGPLRGHAGAVRSVAFSSDGTRIVSGSADGTIRVWDLATVARAHSFSIGYSIDRDGWLTTQSKRLFWVPPELRLTFGIPIATNPVVINAGCTTRIDDSTLLGDRWRECYKASSQSDIS